MDDRFVRYDKDPIAPGTSLLIVGRSGAGKTVFLRDLCTHFDDNFALPTSSIKNVVILHSAEQTLYRDIFELFSAPDCRKISATKVCPDWNETSWWTQTYGSSRDASLCILDDRQSQLTGTRSDDLTFLSNLLHVVGHHGRVILLCALQTVGSTDSAKLRSLIKFFNVFVLYQGLPEPTMHYFGLFLSPSKPRVLSQMPG